MYSWWREFIAELLGTLLMILLGCGVNAMALLFKVGGYTNITLGWGAGVFLGILVSGRISGAHLNPAVSLALAITRRFAWRKLPHYVIAQMLGGFLGAALVYYFYQAKLLLVDPHLAFSASIFTTFPAVSAWLPGFMAEVIATAVLLFGILTIVNYFNAEKAEWLAPFAVGLLIMAIGMSLGGMHGYAMNPARDLSPRIFVYLMGFKHSGLTGPNYIWLPTVAGSLIGGPVGAVLYHFTVGSHMLKRSDQ